MSFCRRCGQALVDDDAFCSHCGLPVKAATPALVPVTPQRSAEELQKEEQSFLETTHRLLRWEMKAWSIASKVYIISGIIFAALFMLYFFVGAGFVASGEETGVLLMIIGFVYSMVFGIMFIALGIVGKKAAGKIPQYLNTVYTDFSLAYNRCGNVGMLVFCAICGTVSPIFFIINFVRMKSNRAVIERIIQNQNLQK